MSAVRAGARIPTLDGLRGLAILLVLFHHFVIYARIRPEILLDQGIRSSMLAGWIGVDLFFVLSGFLITGILIDAKGSPGYFRNFYARRSLRIFPLYYGVLALAFFLVPLVLTTGDSFAQFHSSQAWYWSYLVNVKIAVDGWGAFYALDHFWSLAVEEQFYLVWPLAIYFLASRGIARLCVGCFVAALVVRFGLVHQNEALAAYVLAPARMDALAAGGFLAVVARMAGGLEPWRGAATRILIASGTALSVLFFWKRGLPELDAFVATAGYSLIAILFAALLTLAVTASPRSIVHRALTSRPLTYLGRYSYGLYVFHQPIMIGFGHYFFTAGDIPRVLGSQMPGLIAFAAVTGALSLVVSIVSWHLFESYFLALKDRFGSVEGSSGAAKVGFSRSR
jgi:peptidoglycan/LPS O-acetylase OafA/YrhL